MAKGITNDIKVILMRSKTSMNAVQLLHALDVEVHTDTEESTIKSIVSQMKRRGHLKATKTYCKCCLAQRYYYTLTDEGRMTTNIDIAHGVLDLELVG